MVPSGVPHGSVLGPLLFVIYINDLPEVCRELSLLFLFADDAKMYRAIDSNADQLLLQESCHNMFRWATDWCMNLNISKCKVLSLSVNKSKMLHYDYALGSNSNSNNNNNSMSTLESVTSISDLGVTVDSELSFSTHIYDKINKAYQILGIVNRNFNNLDNKSFLLLYKSLVRSVVEFASSVWSPYKVGLIYDLERVQKRATKLISSCKKYNYKERLMYLKLPTLKFRRARGDMIEVYKILHGFYDKDIVPSLPRSNYLATRGHSLKLLHVRSHYDFKKYSFCSRVVGLWNSLPDSVVNALSVNGFKNCLDKFWAKEEMYFDWKADLVGSIM